MLLLRASPDLRILQSPFLNLGRRNGVRDARRLVMLRSGFFDATTMLAV